MSKALWSVQFFSNMQDFGSGVVILDGDQAVGGDHGYYYHGKCVISGNSVSAVISVKRHNPKITSVFGNLESFTIALTGNVAGDQISLAGEVQGYPQAKITGTMKKALNL